MDARGPESGAVISENRNGGVEQQPPPVFLSIKESIRRRRVNSARQLDAEVNQPDALVASHTKKKKNRKKAGHNTTAGIPSSVDHDAGLEGEIPVVVRNTALEEATLKYITRIEEAFEPASPARAALLQQQTVADAEDEEVEAELRAELVQQGVGGVMGEQVGGCWKQASDGVEEVTITSYSHFVDVITNCKGLYNELTQRYNTKIAFKGSSCRGGSLNSPIKMTVNSGSATEHEHMQAFEAESIRSFMEDHCVGGPDTPPSDPCSSSVCANVWALLCLMHRNKHPTRLLEWTFNPNVALYFAVENPDYMSEDGEIWLVKPAELYNNQRHILSQELDRLHMYCPTAQQQQEVVSSFDPETAARSSSGGATAMAADLARFDAMSSARYSDYDSKGDRGSGGPCLNFLEPCHFDTRMINQACVYSVVSDPAVNADEILKNVPNCTKRIIIPSFLKGVLLQSLHLVNITDQWLFPSDAAGAVEEVHMSHIKPAMSNYSPDDIAYLLKEKEEKELSDRREAIRGRRAKERVAREQRHKEKAWPLTDDNGRALPKKSSRGILCKKSFIDPPQIITSHSFEGCDDNSMVDLGSSSYSISVAPKTTAQNSTTRVSHSRRQSMDTATIISISDVGSFAEEPVYENTTSNTMNISDTSRCPDRNAHADNQGELLNGQGVDGPEVGATADILSPLQEEGNRGTGSSDTAGGVEVDAAIEGSSIDPPFMHSSYVPHTGTNSSDGVPCQQQQQGGTFTRAMRGTLNFVGSPIRGMQGFIKKIGSASKYAAPTVSAEVNADSVLYTENNGASGTLVLIEGESNTDPAVAKELFPSEDDDNARHHVKEEYETTRSHEQQQSPYIPTVDSCADAPLLTNAGAGLDDGLVGSDIISNDNSKIASNKMLGSSVDVSLVFDNSSIIEHRGEPPIRGAVDAEEGSSWSYSAK